MSGTAQTAPSTGGPGAEPAREAERLQALVDRAASFELLAVPEGSSGGAPVQGAGGAVVGFRQRLALHRFHIELAPLSADGMRGVNRAGEVVGHLDLDWRVVPWKHVARPEDPPPATGLDSERSQRFAIQEARFSFAGGDELSAFGTGRTLPRCVDGVPRLTAAAVATLDGRAGDARGLQGNLVLCGEISRRTGFTGHLMLRIVDVENRLRSVGELPALEEVPDPTPDVTYLTWIARKGRGEEWANYFSAGPDGRPRGVNIPVELRGVVADVAATGDGLRVRELSTGGVVGKEIGFGREIQPRTGRNGTARSPFLFEGVSEYHFRDPSGTVVGAMTANFLEGRSMQVRLPGAADQPALRFSYYGAVVAGEGCFEGVTGTIYGTAGSVFAPPPFEHVITNLYAARLYDPYGRFRATAAGGGA